MGTHSDLRPLRIPLQSKKSKRCPSCRHILIKPEQKAQSVRFKIKLVAANYLPAIGVTLPHAQAALEMMKRSSAKAASAQAAAEEQHAAAGALIAGHSYSFHLAFTNPLYDPIQIRLAKAAAPAQHAGAEEGASGAGPGGAARPRPPPPPPPLAPPAPHQSAASAVL